MKFLHIHNIWLYILAPAFFSPGLMLKSSYRCCPVLQLHQLLVLMPTQWHHCVVTIWGGLVSFCAPRLQLIARRWITSSLFQKVNHEHINLLGRYNLVCTHIEITKVALNYFKYRPAKIQHPLKREVTQLDDSRCCH